MFMPFSRRVLPQHVDDLGIELRPASVDMLRQHIATAPWQYYARQLQHFGLPAFVLADRGLYRQLPFRLPNLK